ncbi:tRNA splicing endonuclease subunit sen2 [Metarhizium acridum]|uniref:tRNA-intron lyase n=1 Tax=Metarhizium acridum (strain CQMa 102) TaxID=655827 RepID=E9E2G9_METAQ|nr:tRNA-splicing endonuclease subunit Sen2, putative [Metarhizium acridum CQMa 102]EFY89858.1 tRNA-splicing endonuclease subunit Sen2, putative [Metarhizium acridum CQMa 102]KAG8424764.1 tRNA splicing endonuclease subunit sen2 [Metarhizium acridum]
MAEIQQPPKEDGQVTASPAQASTKSADSRKRGPSVHQIYALPAPIRTFPLPAFYPNNPLSFFAVAYAWLRQVFAPPPAEPTAVHQGVWSKKTFSVHVTDEKSMRALWEQGFYGKGSLSRSEPNWLKREQVRRGMQKTHVSEILTVQRREERAQAKWERARLEQESIRQTRLKEAQQAEADSQSKTATLLPSPSPVAFAAPTGPLELLSLPNSAAEASKKPELVSDTVIAVRAAMEAVMIPLPVDIAPPSILETGNGIVDTNVVSTASFVAGSPQVRGQSSGIGVIETPHPPASETSSDSAEDKTLKRQKSVRFSPKVESTTFNLADPPSPHHSLNGKGKRLLNGALNGPGTAEEAKKLSAEESEDVIVNREHLQLMPEEAFFLTFGFGALSVTDPASGKSLTAKEMLTLFRQYSYFPPRTGGPDESDLGPDDGFLVHYAVYHHFRSLGWVPRAGIKFGVDWLLYTRGPVFDHAEFGLIIVPSYSDAWWKDRGKQGPQKTWAWLHSVIRVLSHVIKSLVLVYVDIPPPPKFDAALETGFAEALHLYRVREVMVKRWSSNRNR